MIFEEVPRAQARAHSGQRVPSCAYPRFCKARKLAMALGETGLRRAIEVAPEELLDITIRTMGLQPKNQKVYGLVRARIAQLPKPPLHCVTWLLASSPIVTLADIVDAATGLTVDDIANGIVIEAEIEKAMREGAIEEWTQHWPASLLSVAVETMWDQGYYAVTARDEFLERLRNPLPPGQRSAGKGVEEPGTDGRPAISDEAARSRPPLAPDGPEADSSLAAVLRRAVAAVETALVTGGDPDAELAGVEWLLRLDPDSRICWLAYGRIAALLDRPEGAEPPRACRGDLTAGRILGLAHRGDSRSVIELSGRPEMEELLASPPDPFLVQVVLGACLAEPRLSARLLRWVSEPFEGWERYVADLRSRSEELLGRGAGADVEALLGSAEECLSRWDAAWPESEMALSPQATTIGLLRVSARRRVGDFVGASRLISHIDRTRLETADTARLMFESAMISGELRSTDALALDPTSDRRRLVDRLERARPDLDLVLEAEPRHQEANLAQGMLAALTGDDAAAVGHLTAVPGDAGRSGPLASTVRFHLGLSRLRLLEPQTGEGAQQDLVEAVDSGYGPSTTELVSVVEALDAHGSQEVGAWLARSVEQAPRSEAVTQQVVEHARGPEPTVRELAEAMGGDSTRKLADRFDLLAAALAGAEAAGDLAAVDRIVGALDEVVTRVNRPEIDDRWAAMLGTDEAMRTALEPAHADALRIDVLRRCGRHPEALGVAKALFYRAAAGTLAGFDAAELLEVVDELGEEAEELQRMSRLVRSDVDADAGAEVGDRPVRILFVGGNESQEAYRLPLDQEMAERYEGKVGVEWFFSGWTSNWNKVAEKVEASYDQADAVVLMTFVRTNFGRWVRRTTGERGLPWIACTGHGRTALSHAIHRAVQVARATG